MILIIIIFICQEANASFGKVLIHPSYFHVHFLFSTFTPFFFNDACCCGAAFPLYLLESGAMFFSGLVFFIYRCNLYCFHFHFLFPSSRCCLLSTYLLESGGMFLAEGPFPRSHRRPLPARKEDGGEGRGLLEDRWGKGRRNYQIFAHTH